jgi:hypothetical protein
MVLAAWARATLEERSAQNGTKRKRHRLPPILLGRRPLPVEQAIQNATKREAWEARLTKMAALGVDLGEGGTGVA